MCKLLATDIDGTILAHDGTLPEQNRLGLRRLHAAGVTIVFASGRADVGIQQLAPRIIEPNDDDYLIAFNGARIVTADSRIPVFELLLSAQSVSRLVRYCRENGLYVQSYAGDDFVVEKESDDTHAYAASVEMSYRVVGDIIQATPRTPKLLIVGDHEVLADHLPRLKSLGASVGDTPGAEALTDATAQGDGDLATGFEVAFSKPRYLEIVAKGVDKGTALVALADRLGIPIAETLALGDSGNDVPLLVAAGTGVAVGDAREEAKAAADAVLESGADYGILDEVISRFFPTV